MKRFISIVMAVIMLLTIAPLTNMSDMFSTKANAATFEEINQSSVFLKQPQGSVTCTLYASAMMLRRTAMARGSTNWSSITPAAIQSNAWLNGVGILNSFSYDGMYVNSAYLSGGTSNIDTLKNLLVSHPEGIVIYNTSIPHAVLLTDYTNGVFYCADSDPVSPSGRIPLSNISLGVTISNVTKYWYVSSPSVTISNNRSLDVDVIVDGTTYKSGYTGFTFDVHINGAAVASNVMDYYNGSVKDGASWSLVNIKNPSEYVVTGSLDAYGNFFGVLNQDTLVKPNFKKPTLKSTKYFNGSRYEFYSVTTSWDSANLFAKRKGGHLVTINSAEENEFIKNNDTVGACWIGGTKTNDRWGWTTGESFSYTNWKENQPDNNTTTCVDGEKYLMMYDTGKWNDCPCYWSTVTGFIVEYNHTHSYTSKTTTSAYLKSAATCTSPATYYYKCADCDEKGTETYTSGSALGHTESAWIIDKEATTTAAGSKHIECTVCHTTIRTATIPKITTTDSKLVIESKKAKAGDEIEVSVSLDKNPGIAGLQISLNYDTSVFTLKNSKNGSLFSGFTAGKNFVWDDSSNVTADGKIATFTFTVADNAAAGEYEISAIIRSCTNEAFDDVELAVESGVVTVVDFTYGDANDDDAINMKDVVLLRQYLANYDYDTNTSTVTIGAGADANGDGAINMKDVVILRQYLANFDYDTNTSTVVLGPQN